MFAEVGPQIQTQQVDNLNFAKALKKRTELKRIFRNFNVVLQRIGISYVLEIQVSTPEDREKVLKHPQYKNFAPYITLEAVGIKNVTESTAQATQDVIDYYRGDMKHHIKHEAKNGLRRLARKLPPWLKGKVLHVNHANRESKLNKGQLYAFRVVVNKKQAAMRILKDEKLQPFLPYLHLQVEAKQAA